MKKEDRFGVRARSLLAISGLAIMLVLSGCPSNPDQAAKVNPDLSRSDLPSQITFRDHIAPIIYNNCTPCHREGGSAPFRMAQYEDVAKRARMVSLVTSRKIMPPWPADPEYRHFLGEKVLSEEEIELIRLWAEAGAPQGDSTKPVFPPAFPENSNLGEPDLVIKFPPHKISGLGRDEFLLMKVPYEISKDTFVRTIEFVPGSRKIVHHMNGNLIEYPEGAKQNVFKGERVIKTDLDLDPGTVWKRMDLYQDNGQLPAYPTLVSNYLPGVIQPEYPEGIGGFDLPRKGVFFINDMHYGPSSEEMVDESRFNIFFAESKPLRPTKEFLMGTVGKAGAPLNPPLIIPPDTVMTFRTQYTLPQPISVVTLNPHMHLLGESFMAYAIEPSGDTIPLIKIDDWNFRWQYFYTLPTMLPLSKGTTIYVEGVMDNTSNNPDNPYDPPRVAREPTGNSMRTVDEMLQFIVTYVDWQPGDDTISLAGKQDQPFFTPRNPLP